MLETELLVRYKILAFFILATLAFGQKHPNNKIDLLLIQGIEHLVLQDYKLSSKSFRQLEEEFPENPLGNIYSAAAEIARAADYQEQINIGLVDSLLILAKEKNDKLLKNDPTNIWYNYYEALIFGYKAYYSALIENFISAFSEGVLSLKSFDNCLEKERNFSEAFIAIGTYNYWKSAQVKSLLWIPFVSDNREEGIKFLEDAIDANSYNKYLAAYSLVWIYIDFDKSEQAVALSLRMLKKYPESRFFKWGLARAYQDIDKSKSIEVFYELLQSVKLVNSNNQYNEIVLMHKIAMLYNEIGEFNKSFDLCNQILDFNFKSSNIKKRLNNRIERTKILLMELNEKIN